MAAWLIGRTKENIKGKETSFERRKHCPNEENKKEHKETKIRKMNKLFVEVT